MGEVDEMDERLDVDSGAAHGHATPGRVSQCQQVVMASVWQPAWTRQREGLDPFSERRHAATVEARQSDLGACHGRLQVRRDRARGGNPRRPAVPVDLDLGVEVTQSIQHFGAAHHLTDPAHQGSNNSVRLVGRQAVMGPGLCRAAQNVG